jgi:hypothetical protein
MNPLAIFRDIFPSHRLTEIPGELRYIMPSDVVANAYSVAAFKTIMGLRLPLVSMLDIWRSRGKVREIALVVREAPEQDVIERSFPEHSESPVDECGDDEDLLNDWVHLGME